MKNLLETMLRLLGGIADLKVARREVGGVRRAASQES